MSRLSYPILDGSVVESTNNVEFRVNVVEKIPDPVIVPDRPWENNMSLIFGSVLRDPAGKFRMWYMCAGGDVAYATSDDGISWEKPSLGLVVRNGEDTNIVIERGKFGNYYEIFGVVKDDVDVPSRRYKMGFVSIERDYDGPHQARYHPGQRRGLGTAVSPDGIHWTLEQDFASHGICDVSHFLYDEQEKKYVLYGRTKLQEDHGPYKSWGWGRAVLRMESDDFRTWTGDDLVMAADGNDPEGMEIYSMSVHKYWETYIGLVQVFYGLPSQGQLEIQLATSRDGHKFTRLAREPFIPEGPVGSWDRFNISVGNMPPVRVGDEDWFYYSGRHYRHKPYIGEDTSTPWAAIGLARVKRGRYLSLESSFDGGTVTTRPLPLRSGLQVNANAAHGSIEIELLGDGGDVTSGRISCLAGVDGIEIPVKLPDDLGSRTRIRFTLANARLFGFRLV
jgi:hypothetical protein